MKYQIYNKDNSEHQRKELRKNSTESEKKLWQYLFGEVASMSKKERFVVKVAGRNGMNICMFWSSFLMTRPSSKKNISAILRLAAGTTVHAMFRNMITSPVSRNNRSRTDISNRLAGRNHNYTFFKTNLTMISIV